MRTTLGGLVARAEHSCAKKLAIRKALALVAVLAIPATVQASNLYYIGPDGGNWNNAANWSATSGGPGGAGVPGIGDRAILDPATTKSVTFDADYAAPGLLQLYLDGQSGATVTLNQSAHAMVGTLESVGIQGTGVYHQTGGSNTSTADFHVGQAGGGTGTYLLDGGSLDVGASEYIGEGASTGSFTENGGTHVVHDALKVAFASGSAGNFTLNNGSLAVNDPAGSGYLTIGYLGTGTFTQTGGSVNVAHMQLAQGATGNATYELQSGNLTVNGSEAIGEGGTGVFTQSGGTHTMTGNLYLTLDPGSSGTYNLNGGTLNVTGNIVNNGTMTQGPAANLNLGGTVIGNGIILTNGPVALANQTNINSGTVRIAAGTATAQTLIVGKDATDPDVPSNTIPGNGTLDIRGGTTTIDGTLGAGNNGTLTGGAGNGTIDVSGGTVNAKTVILGSPVGGSGTMNIRATGQVVIGGGFTANDLIMDGGSLTVLDQAPPPGEDPVLDRSIVGGYLHDGAMVMNGGTVTTPNLKIGVTPGKVGTLTMNGGSLTTANLLAAKGAGSVIAFNGGTLVTGHSEVDGGSAFVIGDGVHDAKLVLNQGGHVFAHSMANSVHGQVSGAGAITGDVLNDGVLSPGINLGDAGLMTVTGNYTQTSNGTLELDLGSGAAGVGFDALRVSGSATLGGTLRLRFTGSHLPAIGQQIAFLTGHPRTGSFASIQGAGFSVTYNDTGVVATYTAVDVPAADGAGALALALEPIQPNPMRSGANIDFAMPSAGSVSLAIHDASGRLVRTLAQGEFGAGRHSANWDGRNEVGALARPGVYLVRLAATGKILSRKLVVMP